MIRSRVYMASAALMVIVPLTACGQSSLAAAPSWARPLRVDLGMNTGRNDTGTPGWQEWQVADSATATQTFDGVTVTLRAVSSDGKSPAALRGVWNKKGLAKGATMATDGVQASGANAAATLEIAIEGLPAGQHSLVTYHNLLDDAASDAYRITVDGAAAENSDQQTVEPSHQAADNLSAASACIPFTVGDRGAALIRIAAANPHADAQVILNGFEIGAVDPTRKCRAPSPADDDAHVDGDDGRVRLEWRPPASAVKYELYFAAGDSADAAFETIAAAVSGSPAHLGTIDGSSIEVSVDPNKSLLHYAWRVDAIDAAGRVTPGDVWTFRPRHLAFPGAEGYGRFAIGGRGGAVLKVTNLNDSGPGSFRAAVEADGPRTIIFDVGGKIVLQSKLIIRNPYLTIAGQTAPGKGICLANYNLGMLGTHDAIIRYLRVRPGDTSGQTLDGMGMASTDHSIIDHCSISWTQDEAFSSRGARNVTLQRTLISEALNIAGHKKYKKGTQHGYAASISGDVGSFHHNLLAHCSGRNWSLAGGLDKATRHAGRLDIRNNVVFNWGHRTTDGGARQVNFVNNYYKPGPASDVFHVLMAEREAVPAFGPQEYFVAGNVMEGRYDADEPLAGVFERGGEPHANFIVEKPFFESFVATQTAEKAFDDVLKNVGCNIPTLDDHDRRVIDEVRDGVAAFTGSVSGLKGLPDSQKDVGGWEDYPEVNREAGWDSDDDGIPDAWEDVHGLNPRSPAGDLSDANGDRNHDGYTNLEDYLSSVVAEANARQRAAAKLTATNRGVAELESVLAQQADAADETYLFTSFRENGADGLHFLTSEDGLKWAESPGTFLKPTVGQHQLMRDPSLARGPDGTFHLVWTTGWKDDQGFGYANSKDLIHWSEQQFIPVMEHEPTTVNVWAPELFYDEPNDQFIVCWASTIPGRFSDNGEPHDNNQRMYCTTTRDFKEFSPAQLFCDPGFSVIDATIVRDGDRYVLVLKNNTRQGHQLYAAVGDTPLGPWCDVTGPFTDHFSEGPTALRLGDEWLVYYDAYRKEIYGAARTKDFKTFVDATGEVSFPKGHKHGTVLKVPRSIVETLKAAAVRKTPR
ncbi:hypothetical protein [Lacipirellula parvula]|uniref:Pectate lyase n=1 Tax=Lacipirellula parvula TaxID=2650471 RepID=A0A5K7XFR3_9BACT|nr:hypothetical protein [Lacipirellula parvula]BBO34842.1 pectate lyase [Lacipirellula parvula]